MLCWERRICKASAGCQKVCKQMQSRQRQCIALHTALGAFDSIFREQDLTEIKALLSLTHAHFRLIKTTSNYQSLTSKYTRVDTGLHFASTNPVWCAGGTLTVLRLDPTVFFWTVSSSAARKHATLSALGPHPVCFMLALTTSGAETGYPCSRVTVTKTYIACALEAFFVERELSSVRR